MSVDNPVRSERDGDVSVIVIDNPPVNATSQGVRAGVLSAIERAGADAACKAVVIACDGRTFIAGGDIKEFGQTPKQPILFSVCDAIEACGKPVVAALHGTVLGGGFEIALGAHARIAAPDTKFGMPEVKLGLTPGAGGTQRLPRLVGMSAALDLISSGRMMDAQEALKLGAIDAIAEGDVRAAAIAHARAMIGQPIRRTGSLAVAALDDAQTQATLADIKKKARGQNAPLEAAKLVMSAAHVTTAHGVAAEREAFLRLMDTQESRALRHIFLAEREAGKVPGVEGVEPRAIRRVGVAGAGTMGSGIVVALADAGHDVVVVERDAASAQAGRARIEAIYARMVSGKRIDAATKDARMARIEATDDFARFATCDLIIEAVFDDLDVKRDLFARLSQVAPAETILATNTSYLDPDAIAAAGTHPQRVVGMHFFAPANIMRLLEVVRARDTSAQTLATALAVGKKLRKLSIVCGVCEGFIGNRINKNYRSQAEFIVEEGASPPDVDAAMESLGLPMGPFRVVDLSGLDISWALRKRQAATRDPAARYSTMADTLCAMGRFGQKTGAGWYRYEGDTRRIDDEAKAVIAAAAKERGLTPRAFSAPDIQRRLIAAMVNEGAKILEEGIALRESDIDLVFVNGFGWPARIGGPMFQGREIGLARILEEVEAMHRRDGSPFAPARSLVEAARRGVSIEEAVRA